MSKNILVADDDTSILEVIKIILDDNGYNVTTISDGGEVVDYIRKNKPDLLLLDVWMSGHDGREIAQKLKSSPDTKDVPIVIISAHNEAEKMAKQATADACISKPFDMDHLLAMVQKYCS